MVSEGKTASAEPTVKPQTLAEKLVEQAKAARRAGQVTNIDVAKYDDDGFRVVQNKRWLVGRGFVIMATDYEIGEFGDQVVITGVTNSGVPFKMTDGSTGVYQQIGEMVDPQFPLAVNNGLRVSEYERNGRQAATFYLADND